MYLILFICSCLCTLSLLALLAKWVPCLRSSVLAYGKLALTSEKPRSVFAARLARCTVPKSWFLHFYTVGLALALYCAAEITVLLEYQHHGPLLALLRDADDAQGSNHVGRLESLLALWLLIFHLARRCYECVWIERPSQGARMHVSHYLVGLGFYGAMVFGTWLEGAVYFGVWPLSPSTRGGESERERLVILFASCANY